MKRGLIVLTVATTIISAISTGTASAQSLALAAFECSVLALALGEDDPRAADSERLFEIGYEAARDELSNIAPQDFRTALGVTAGYMADQTHDFWIGMTYQSAAQRIADVLDEAVPAVPGTSADRHASDYKWAAGVEYTKRNCAFLAAP